MVKQVFDVERFWKVIVYYDIDYNFFDDVVLELRGSGAEWEDINEIYHEMRQGNAQAFTYSSPLNHVSIVVFNPHTSNEDYLNSIVHEAEHVKQALLKTYKIEDAGEPPAYTIGFLIMKMYRVFKRLF